eukprot:1159347-Pelagomonas_calceolata.AAC.10
MVQERIKEAFRNGSQESMHAVLCASKRHHRCACRVTGLHWFTQRSHQSKRMTARLLGLSCQKLIQARYERRRPRSPSGAQARGSEQYQRGGTGGLGEDGELAAEGAEVDTLFHGVQATQGQSEQETHVAAGGASGNGQSNERQSGGKSKGGRKQKDGGGGIGKGCAKKQDAGRVETANGEVPEGEQKLNSLSTNSLPRRCGLLIRCQHEPLLRGRATKPLPRHTAVQQQVEERIQWAGAGGFRSKPPFCTTKAMLGLLLQSLRVVDTALSRSSLMIQACCRIAAPAFRMPTHCPLFG